MRSIISCSDWTDVAQAEVEIAALKYAQADTRFISVPVTPFSAVNCAFNVRLVAESLTYDTVIMASADPRAPGIPREPIAIQFNHHNLYLVCPNIGIASLLMEKYEPVTAVRLNYDEWAVSVFNGRDIYAPVSGRISSGCPMEELGEEFPLSSIYRLPLERGTVLHVDNYGNVKLYISDDLSKVTYVMVNSQELRVARNHRLKSGELVPTGELIATNGSSFGLVELQMKAERVGTSSASETLGLTVGDVVDFVAH